MTSIKPQANPLSNQGSKILSHHLDGIPEVPVLTDYLHQAMERQVEVQEFKWPQKEGGGFHSLILRSPGLSGEAKWSFYVAADLLWEYSTCDVLLIHNLINMASDQEAHVISGEALLATSQTYRNVTKHSNAYFIRTEVSTDEEVGEKPDDASKRTDSLKSKATTPKPIDSAAIESVMLKLRDVQTGLYTYPAFLYFLEQAYFQSCRTKAPISVALIEITDGSGKPVRLNKEQTFELVTALSSVKRRTDMLAQYESDKLIVLAPSTDHIGSKVFGRRIAPSVGAAINFMFKNRMSYSIGLATFPRDGESMGMLLAAAEAAKNHAVSSGMPLVAHSDLEA